MLRKFQGMREHVEAVPIDLDKESRLLSESESSLTRDISAALEVIEEMPSLELCKESDVQTADLIFECPLTKLEEQEGRVSKDLFKVVKRRILGRRQVKHTSLVITVKDLAGELSLEEGNESKYLQRLPAAEVAKMTRDLFGRLFFNRMEERVDDDVVGQVACRVT